MLMGALIAAIVYDEYSVGPSIRPICTRCCFTMTHTHTHSVYLSVCLALGLSLCHSLTLSLCHSLSLSATHSLSLPLTLSLCHSLSFSAPHSLSVPHSLSLCSSHSLSLPLTLSLCPSHTLSATDSLSLPLTLSLTLTLYPSPSHSRTTRQARTACSRGSRSTSPTACAGTTQGPSWGYSKVHFENKIRKRGRFSPNVDKNEEMAPRTRTGYPRRAFCGVPEGERQGER